MSVYKTIQDVENRINQDYQADLLLKTEVTAVVTQKSPLDFIAKYIEHNSIGTYDGDEDVSFGANRSVIDLYRLCKKYVPNTTLESVVSAINELLETNKIYCFKCGDINRLVFRRCFYDYGPKKDLHLVISKNYPSFKKLLKLINNGN